MFCEEFRPQLIAKFPGIDRGTELMKKLDAYLQQYSTSLDAKGKPRGWAATVDHLFEDFKVLFAKIEKIKKPIETKKNLNAKAAKGSL